MFAQLGPAVITAYIDPGAGGLLTQLLLGGMAGLVVIAKLNWRRVTGLLRRHTMSGEADAPDQR